MHSLPFFISPKQLWILKLVAVLGAISITTAPAYGAVGFSPDPVNFDGLTTRPLKATAADFDTDGRADIVTADAMTSSVSISLASDDTMTKKRSFILKQSKNVGGLPVDVAVGNFNADSRPDVAVAVLDTATLSGSVVVFIGNGDGTLQDRVMYGSLSSIKSLSTGKLNSDNFDDIVATGGNAADRMASTLQTFVGTGKAADPLQSMTSSRPGGTMRNSVGQDAVIADMNFDGKADIAMADSYTNEVVSIPGNGDGSYDESKAKFAAVGIEPDSITATLIGGDGNRDLVVANRGRNADNRFNISILRGNGDGSFAPQEKVDVTYVPEGAMFGDGAPVDVTANDIDDDGRADIAVALPNANRVALLLVDSDGTVQKPVFYGSKDKGLQSPNSVFIDEFTNDNKPDLATVNTDNSRLSIFTNTTTADLQASTSPFDVGSVVPGKTVRKTVKVTNAGGLLPRIGSLTISGTGFSVDAANTDCPGATLSRGAECSIEVTFAPAAGSSLGQQTGSITVASDVGPLTIHLTGTVVHEEAHTTDPENNPVNGTGTGNGSQTKESALKLAFVKPLWKVTLTKRRKTADITFTASRTAKVQVSIFQTVKVKAKKGSGKIKTKLVRVKSLTLNAKAGINTAKFKVKGLKPRITYTLQATELNTQKPATATAKLKLGKTKRR